MKPKESQFPEITESAAAARWNGQRIGYYQNIPVSQLQKDADEGQPRPISGAGLAEGKKDRALVKGSIDQVLRNKRKANQGSGIIQSGKLVKGGTLELRQDLNSKKDGKK